MTWRDQFQEGSFRGAAFFITESDAEGGRRGAVHEYPQRDKPWTEDLGRRARRWAIECFVIGDDYFTDRDALAAALEAEGSGTLVHPYLGTMQACVDPEQPFRLTESTDQGGMARFSISFVESGDDTQPAQGQDTQSAADDAADAVQTAAAGDAAADLSISGQGDQVTSSAEDVLGQAHAAIGGALSSVRSAPSAALGPVQALDQLASQPLALLKAPAQLVSTVFDAVKAIGDQAAFAEDALAALCGPSAFPSALSPLALLAAPANGALRPVINVDGSMTLPPIGAPGAGGLPVMDRFSPGPAAMPLGGLLGFAAGLAVVPTTTAGRRIQAANQGALGRLVVVAAATAAVRVISAMAFTSYQDAAGIRDAMADQLDAVAILAADAGDHATADALDALRAAMSADVTARGGSLARIDAYNPPATVSALVLAQRLYGDAARAEDILGRNAVEHPGFLPGGVALEVLDA